MAGASSVPSVIKGTAVVNNIKGISRPLVAFVSQLHIDTEADQLKTMLEQAGEQGVKCSGGKKWQGVQDSCLSGTV